MCCARPGARHGGRGLHERAGAATAASGDPDAAAGAHPARGGRGRLRRGLQPAPARAPVPGHHRARQPRAALGVPCGRGRLDAPRPDDRDERRGRRQRAVHGELRAQPRGLVVVERTDRRRGLRLPLGADAQRAGRRRRRGLPAHHRGALARRRQGGRRGVLAALPGLADTCSPTFCPRTSSRTPLVPGRARSPRACRRPAARSGSRRSTGPAARCVLARNDLYWDTPAVLDELVLRRLEPQALAPALAAGDVDVALPEAEPAIRTALGGLQPAPRLQQAPQPIVTELGMRADGGPLARRPGAPRHRAAAGPGGDPLHGRSRGVASRLVRAGAVAAGIRGDGAPRLAAAPRSRRRGPAARERGLEPGPHDRPVGGCGRAGVPRDRSGERADGGRRGGPRCGGAARCRRHRRHTGGSDSRGPVRAAHGAGRDAEPQPDPDPDAGSPRSPADVGSRRRRRPRPRPPPRPRCRLRPVGSRST